MMKLFNKPKMEFLCLDETLRHLPSIVEARNLHPSWFDKVTTDYAKKLPYVADVHGLRHISKCRGIRTLLNTGWLVLTYQDMHINVSKEGFVSWATPIDQKEFYLDMVGFHDPDSFAECPTLRDKQPILKVQIPWLAKVPKGYNVLQLPVLYGDTTMFSAATGIYERDFGLIELNIPLFWQAGVGSFVIKAGTPIAHLLLLKDEAQSMSLRLPTKKEILQYKATLKAKKASFCSSYVNLKKQIKQIFKGV